MDLATVKAQVPEHFRSAITQDLLDKLHQLESNPVLANHIQETMVDYISVLRDSPCSMDTYLRLVTFLTGRMRGDDVLACYAKAYPERYAQLVSIGSTEADIRRHAATIEKGKMYVSLVQQALVPSWILNHRAYQQAVTVQVDLMMNSASDMVKTQAANSLLTHLSRPKEASNLIINNNVNAGDDDLGMLKAMMSSLSNKQRDSITVGSATTRDVLDLKASEDGVYE
jgi:hypothetical protein